ncbi:eukaryotic translation initiation factor 2 subunit beta-like isoform X1 [Papaver somniferum]|uniref:eukaryotic translation initiation factor 2 subunit beta-like isoform X1 n=1 Tax=Papaver somniferum TaxID=3469 RepID=UPI000E6F8D6A|nr:eukaryotic translation initiation factor 2 subunit beta-like isoform X1 [Papaver somniferum]
MADACMELLGRFFYLLQENYPQVAAGDQTTMKPVQVLQAGERTVLVNFMDLCKVMHREAEHVMEFLFAEMGISGSLDGQKRLVIEGKFAAKVIEGILEKYINEYVKCNDCNTHETDLLKEISVKCKLCGSEQSVAPVRG